MLTVSDANITKQLFECLKKTLLVLTDHGLQHALSYSNELLVDLDAQVTQNLPVLSQVKVLQAVLVLFWCVLGHECLRDKNHTRLN